MPSLKSYLVAFVLKHTRKKAFASPEGLHAWIVKSRKTQDHRPPVEVAGRVAVTQRQVDGHVVYEVRPKDGEATRRVLYLHGGAYCFEITSFHWRLIAEMCERLSAHISVPVYPLAPEHDFHAIFGMGAAVYRDVMAAADEVAVMGDSAGGNMALVLTLMAAEEGWKLPSRLVLISPGVDMTLTNDETRRAALLDPWLDIPGGMEAVRIYAAELDFSDWRISPSYGELSVLPPTLIFSGTRDLLYPDTVVFAEKARAAGAEVELVTGKGMIHVWPLIDMPETRIARDRMVEFLRGDDAVPAGHSISSSPSASEPAFPTARLARSRSRK
ncbi:alpha/beta hydrolase [Aquamicrobium sp. LC103]|uniref:alpha/beta hydrolase n=1 Tax=Aquamicrobium sp. LC103 TaxID=1120658 RepID=UPI0009E605A6|nr:alpha/beta hydrolase [Aquamicrobium sp. LC103]TKT80415.1 alpha/beta hydrolase [Aquamicrobium sp. LC103]